MLAFHTYHATFSPNECPGLCQYRPGHSLGKNIKWHKMKKLHGFSNAKNIANFEAYCREKNYSKNLVFLRSALLENK